ncbi:MAG TPA: LCP family protein [Gaiellaceae bacterium]|jgi:LCP family protein required for cell wall assembly
MRTTLKRGVGRGAGANGNGKIVLPPGPLSSVTHYRQPEPDGISGFGIMRRVLVGTIIVLSSLAIAIAGGAYLWFHQTVSDISAHTPGVVKASKSLDIPVANAPATALVLGYDHRAGEAPGPSRSDTMMLIRADPTTKTISLLSFPRDLQVPIYCDGNTPVGTDRINAAYARCGANGALLTVKNLIGGDPINYLITVSFHGFKTVVDKLGGVWIDVDRRYYNPHGTGYAYINLQPGYQKLTGGAALDFVRFRHTDSDFVRLARQQAFVRALKDQIAHSFSYTDVVSLVNDVKDDIEVAAGGHKVSGNDIIKYAFFAKDLPGGHIFQPKISDLSGYGEVTAPTSAVQQAVSQFEHPDVQQSKVANTVALGNKPKETAPPVSSVTVTVLNGNGVAGAAANASYLLSQRGYRTVQPPNNLEPNTPTQNYFHTRIYYDASQPKSHAAAVALQNLMQPADIVKLPRTTWLLNLDPGSMLMVVVGSTFHGTIAEAPVVQTPVHVAATVRSDASLALNLLKPIESKSPFKLEVPTVLEQNSYPDTLPSDVPMRYYSIDAKHKAVRLVFRTGGGQFWGVEETNWNDAPILGDKSFQHDLGGREFQLYYAGDRLHMVVLHANGATYWVENTLLDDLSNETMLAIAKGLKPITSVK